MFLRHGFTEEKIDLTEVMIIDAARKCLNRTGKLPSDKRGDASSDFGFSERWKSVDRALRVGVRGLPGGSSLSQLLKKHGLK